MTFQIEAMTTQALGLALDAAAMRQQILATNIANASTVGYVPMRLSFEEEMVDARRRLGTSGSVDPETLAAARMRVEPLLAEDGTPSPVKLDVEVSEIARNAVQYQALAKGLSRHFALMSYAVTEGKK